MISRTLLSRWIPGLRRTANLRSLFPVFFAVAVAAAVIPAAQAQKFVPLYGFTGGPDGQSPVYLVPDSAGNLYGVTEYGGQSYIGPYGLYEVSFGTLFEVNHKGAQAVLHTFTIGAPADGWNPTSVILGGDGNLYGTTFSGGDINCGVTNGCGVVFKYSHGTYSVLHTFTGAPDGQGFAGPLVQDSEGNLYGVTAYGGSNSSCYDSSTGTNITCGTLYKLDSKGNETILYSFAGGSDGAWPQGNLVLDSSGNLYGTALNGGTGCTIPRCGTVFKFNLTSGKLTTLHSFTGGTKDGANPNFLVMDSSGNLYGHAFAYPSGAVQPTGNVYKITPAGVFSVVHTLAGTAKQGGTPVGPLVLDASGNLYGATFSGGTLSSAFLNGGGVVFKVNLSTGKETVLHSFLGLADGLFPEAVAMDKAGTLYGVACGGGWFGYNAYGGSCEGGTVFTIKP